MSPSASKTRSSSLNSLILKDVVTKKLYAEIPNIALPGVSSRARINTVFHSEGEPSERVDHIVDGFTFPLVMSSLVCLLSSIQFGYHIGCMNAPETYIENDIGGNMKTLFPTAVAMMPVGGWIGGSIGGTVAEKLGRRTTLLLNNFFFIGAAALMYFAQESWELIVGRFIAGLGCGIVTCVVPMYLGEIAPPNLRGTLGNNEFSFVSPHYTS